MSEEPDPLRAAFDELRAVTMPSMRPIGADRVVTTVRRRRNVRTSVAVVAVLAGAGFAYGIGGMGSPPGGSSSPAAGGSSYADSTRLLSGVSPAPSVPTSPLPSGASRSRKAAASRTEQRKPCAADGIGVWVSTDGFRVSEEFAAVPSRQEPPCAGVSVPLFWASYVVNADGTGSLYASGAASLDAAHRRVSIVIRAPAVCSSWFVGHNVTVVPLAVSAPIAALVADPTPGGPFWDNKHRRSGLVARGRTLCPSAPSAPPSPAASPGG